MLAGARLLTLCPVLAVVGVAAAAGQQPPAEPFAEELEVRETSVTAEPPAGRAGAPAADALELLVDGLAQRVTRIEPVTEGGRGDWSLVAYFDPELAGAETRLLAALALAQQAEALAALGALEVVVVAGGGHRTALKPTGRWQRIEAGLMDRALEARRRLERGEPGGARPDPDRFRERLGRLLEALAERGVGGPRAVLLPSDGLDEAFERAELERLARSLAADGWITVPVAWSEQPTEQAAARLNEFESWKQGAEGRDVGAGQRRYVIDLGRVAREIGGREPEEPGAAEPRSDPRLTVLRNLAAPTSGRLVRTEAELLAALEDLNRRWRIWFQIRGSRDGRPQPLEVRLEAEKLRAPAWIR